MQAKLTKVLKATATPTPNVVDSSAWLEYLTGGVQAARFADVIEDSKRLIVPAIILYEVFKKVLRERGEQAALQIAAAMHAGKVVPVDAALALDAARYPMSQTASLIYATAQRLGATVWTQDDDFKDLPGVKYFAKSSTTVRKK